MQAAATLLTIVGAAAVSILVFRMVVQGIAERRGLGWIVSWREAFIGWFIFSIASGIAGAAIGTFFGLLLSLW